jgi:putative colanic acid biosysnthesis UDP-glucose lipid carrier transferase
MNSRFSRLLQFYGISTDFLVLNSVYLTAKHLIRSSVNTLSIEYLHFWICLNASWLIISWLNGLYTEKRMSSFEVFSRSTMRNYIYWLVAVLVYLFFTRQLLYQRLFITMVLMSFGIMLLTNRFLFLVARTYMRQKHLLTRKVLIVGYNDTAKKLTEYLEDEDNFTEIVGYCEKEENVHELTHYPILSNVENVMQVSLQKGVEEIYSTIAPEHNFSVYQLMKETEQACIRFRVIPDLSYFINRPFYVEFLKDIPVLTFRREPLEDSSQRLKKRLLDIIVSLFVIVFILSWLMPLLALLIYLESPGPIFFKQLRSGRNNKAFSCLKFRSMRMNNDAHLKQASRDDNRITRIGRFIRKTSLDEFPQFFNVLKGEMSLVGPRPHMLKHTDDYSQVLEQYMVRHFAKPGITGWAQVNGYRGETRELEQMKGRVEHDIWYLENWSLWLDVKIIILTAYNILRGEKNAF